MKRMEHETVCPIEFIRESARRWWWPYWWR